MPNALVISGEYRKPTADLVNFRSVIPLDDDATTKDTQRLVREFAINNNAIVTRTSVRPISIPPPSQR